MTLLSVESVLCDPEVVSMRSWNSERVYGMNGNAMKMNSKFSDFVGIRVYSTTVRAGNFRQFWM